MQETKCSSLAAVTGVYRVGTLRSHLPVCRAPARGQRQEVGPQPGDAVGGGPGKDGPTCWRWAELVCLGTVLMRDKSRPPWGCADTRRRKSVTQEMN